MIILDIPQTGKQGTMVSYRHGPVQCRRKHVIPYDPRTPVQIDRRKHFKDAALLWHSLNATQLMAWSLRAGDVRSHPRLGQSGKLSAYQLFCQINCNLASIGLPMVPDPPPLPLFGDNPVQQLLPTLNEGVFSLKLTVCGKFAEHIILQAAAPRSPGTNYVDHFTILGLLPEPVDGQSDITELYVRQWGQPPSGSRLFIELIQQLNGWQRLPRRLTALVPNV